MKIDYFDIGLNLFSSQFHDPAEILQGAHENGVQVMITGSDMPSSESAAEFVKTHSCYATAGIHPHAAGSVSFTGMNVWRQSANAALIMTECSLPKMSSCTALNGT